MATKSTKKAKPEEEEYEEEEEAVEEETADEAEVEEEEEEEGDDFRKRAAKSTKKAAGKKKASGEEEEEEEAPRKKKGKVLKVVKKKASGGGRADWDTPWRPTSVLAEAFKTAQKGTTVKELKMLAKKQGASEGYVLSALKREDFRGFTWKTKGDGKTFKVFNVVQAQGRAKKAA